MRMGKRTGTGGVEGKKKAPFRSTPWTKGRHCPPDSLSVRCRTPLSVQTDACQTAGLIAGQLNAVNSVRTPNGLTCLFWVVLGCHPSKIASLGHWVIGSFIE